MGISINTPIPELEPKMNFIQAHTNGCIELVLVCINQINELHDRYQYKLTTKGLQIIKKERCEVHQDKFSSKGAHQSGHQ